MKPFSYPNPYNGIYPSGGYDVAGYQMNLALNSTGYPQVPLGGPAQQPFGMAGVIGEPPSSTSAASQAMAGLPFSQGPIGGNSIQKNTSAGDNDRNGQLSYQPRLGYGSSGPGSIGSPASVNQAPGAGSQPQRSPYSQQPPTSNTAGYDVDKKPPPPSNTRPPSSYPPRYAMPTNETSAPGSQSHFPGTGSNLSHTDDFFGRSSNSPYTTSASSNSAMRTTNNAVGSKYPAMNKRSAGSATGLGNERLDLFGTELGNASGGNALGGSAQAPNNSNKRFGTGALTSAAGPADKKGPTPYSAFQDAPTSGSYDPWTRQDDTLGRNESAGYQQSSAYQQSSFQSQRQPNQGHQAQHSGQSLGHPQGNSFGFNAPKSHQAPGMPQGPHVHQHPNHRQADAHHFHQTEHQYHQHEGHHHHQHHHQHQHQHQHHHQNQHQQQNQHQHQNQLQSQHQHHHHHHQHQAPMPQHTTKRPFEVPNEYPKAPPQQYATQPQNQHQDPQAHHLNRNRDFGRAQTGNSQVPGAGFPYDPKRSGQSGMPMPSMQPAHVSTAPSAISAQPGVKGSRGQMSLANSRADRPIQDGQYDILGGKRPGKKSQTQSQLDSYMQRPPGFSQAQGQLPQQPQPTQHSSKQSLPSYGGYGGPYSTDPVAQVSSNNMPSTLSNNNTANNSKQLSQMQNLPAKVVVKAVQEDERSKTDGTAQKPRPPQQQPQQPHEQSRPVPPQQQKNRTDRDGGKQGKESQATSKTLAVAAATVSTRDLPHPAGKGGKNARKGGKGSKDDKGGKDDTRGKDAKNGKSGKEGGKDSKDVKRSGKEGGKDSKGAKAGKGKGKKSGSKAIVSETNETGKQITTKKVKDGEKQQVQKKSAGNDGNKEESKTSEKKQKQKKGQQKDSE
ncbi:hypothetical protein DIPPA_70132 [Diplonema papillatum]|nr:hypothetical protein DIPPA_70132 [Diplonema papillatum]